MRLSRLYPIVACALLATGVPISPAYAQGSTVDFIRGKITGNDKKGIEGVVVTVTSIALQTNRQTRTGKDGTYQLQFPDGQGDYWIGLAALGYNAKRFELKRNFDEEVLIGDATMTTTLNTLPTVRTTANRPRPPMNDNSTASKAAGDLTTVDQSLVQLDMMGDLSALAATLPGVTYIPGADGAASSLSVLGLDPSQNSYLVNGADNNGSISPDAPASINVASSVYDPILGRYSGLLVSATLAGGGNIAIRRGRFTGDAPPLQFTDAVGRQEGLTYSDYVAGGNLSGPIVLDKVFYNTSYTLSHQYSTLEDLLNTGPDALQTAGISPDSVARLLGVLGALGVLPTASGVPTDKITNSARVTSVFDFNSASARGGGQAFKLSFVGNYTDNQAIGLATSALPSRGVDRSQFQGSVSGRHSALFGFVASETNIAVSELHLETTPYANEPAGSVLVSSNFPNLATPAVSYLAFGGGSAPSTSTTTSANLTNLLRWFSIDSKHTFKFGNGVYFDESTANSFPNEYGTFTYTSLAALQSGQPSVFTRNLTPTIQNLSQGAFGSSLGDSWRPTPDVQVVYGARVDGNRFNERPAEDAQVEQIFGLRNDYVPDRVYASPRIGFSWVYGTAPTIGAFQGSARTVRAVVSGGVGLFQNVGTASQIAQAINTTGLPSSAQQLDCVGAAVPVPDWNAYDVSLDSVPAACANGTTGTVFNSTAPNVTLFDSDYWQPRTIRATLNWGGPVLWNHLNANIGTTYSVAQHQASFVDLNFNPVQQFTLADEANRPVYVQPASIFPATGAIAAEAGRVTQDFNQVRELKSDGENVDERLVIQIRPVAYNYALSWSAYYTFEDLRDRERGFGYNTAANPDDFQWGRSANSRHVFSFSPTYNVVNTVSLSSTFGLRSPVPYTPLVSGDINGDGYSDDRAFVFNPATVTDPTLEAGMQSLLGSTSAAARTCLTTQMGTIAARNSCAGPWTFSMTSLTLSLNPQRIRLTQRATVQLTLSNPPAAADMLLHGVDNQHGWGQTPTPQSTLLYVRGFDPNSNSFLYTVNPRFGSTNFALSTLRTPVRLSIYFRYNIGEPNEEQNLMRTMDRGRTTAGLKAAAPQVKSTVSTGIYNPMSAILQNSDSLHLTTGQADSIATLDRYFTAHADSIWTPVAGYLTDMPDKYSHSTAYAHYQEARKQVVDLLIEITPKINRILTGDQMRRLPSLAAQWLDPRYLRIIRASTISP